VTQKPNSSPLSGKASSQSLKKVRKVRSNIKSVLVISFDCEDVVQQEFVSTGSIVNQYYFWKVLYHVRE
jgi:phosphate starvation-inducible protein PhoH